MCSSRFAIRYDGGKARISSLGYTHLSPRNAQLRTKLASIRVGTGILITTIYGWFHLVGEPILLQLPFLNAAKGDIEEMLSAKSPLAHRG